MLTIAISACNITKNVPEDRYLLVSNKLEIPKKTKISEDDARNVIRQRTNHRTLGFRLKLRAYNAIDSTKTAEARKRKYKRYQKKNERRLERQERINNRRIERALSRGKDSYRKKRVKLKDTLNPKPTWRGNLKYEFGEAPKVFDTSSMNTSQEQLELFLQKKGYFDGTVKSSVKYNDKKRTAKVKYIFDSGDLYHVDSLYLVTKNKVIENLYKSYLEEGENVLTTPFRFDTEALGKMRKSMAEYMRNRSVYGFRESYINFEVDTIGKDKSIDIALKITDRKIEKDGKKESKPFDYFKVKNVFFHLRDTFQYEGNFYKEQIKDKGRSLSQFDDIPTFDTLVYDEYEGNNSEFRTATFLYNGKLPVNAELLEFQNYLEENNYYKGEYVDQSYNRLLQTDLFQNVQSEIIENEDNTINVHYYLVPQKKQRFSFEPKGTHSNSYLGVSASLNYINKNLFRGGERLTVSFSGGIESQPAVFEEIEETTALSDDSRSFNTLEFGPSIQLDVPGLFPIGLTKLSKRQNPETSFSTAYKYQLRPDFKRQTVQLNYLWRFYDVYRTQIFTIGIPLIGGVQFVSIDKSKEFEERLEDQNDLFLLNAYSNQAIWKDLKISYQWTNQERREGDLMFSYGANFDMAGMIVDLLMKDQPLNAEGNKEFFGLRYSQFIRLDNEIRLHHYLEGERSLNYKLQIGGGLPFGNNAPNLPFDYSFSGGGSNDNRGFRARSLGPGGYKYYLDTNRTVTEIGDIRLGGSVEYRFRITDLFKGAVFSDFGNIWTYNEDSNRPEGQFTSDWYKQLSLSAGLGLRLDLSFLIFRLDFGLPLRNPALPQGAQWIFQDSEPYIQEGIEKWGVNSNGDYLYKDLMPNPFQPQIHIAIGYPF
ncbi:MAG: BamA/TamA family outer membrane protein [Brumimicrobium sp.]